MFEQEAIEFSEQKTKSENFNPNEPYDVGYRDGLEIGFMKGAEFGYNKAIVEIKDAYEGNGNFSAWFENYLEGKNV